MQVEVQGMCVEMAFKDVGCRRNIKLDLAETIDINPLNDDSRFNMEAFTNEKGYKRFIQLVG